MNLFIEALSFILSQLFRYAGDFSKLCGGGGSNFGMFALISDVKKLHSKTNVLIPKNKQNKKTSNNSLISQ